MTFLKSLTIPFLDFIYPPICLTCEERLEHADEKICDPCRTQLKILDETFPVWNELRMKFSESGSIDDFTSCYIFEKDGRLQDAVHALKYQGMHSVGTILGRDVGSKIAGHPAHSKADYIVAVPLHKLKRRERGYNQAEYIGNGISEITGIPTHHMMLQRTRYTETQTQLDIHQRKGNVSNAFALNPKCAQLVPGKSFILVDDIITTGSTISECARILKKHGAIKVYAASVGLAE
jgi:ComF family protein